jgi:hypothetical protein
MKKALHIALGTVLVIGASAQAVGADPIGVGPSILDGSGLGQSSSFVASVAAIPRVPDGGTTFVLLSCALTGVAALRRRVSG